MASHLLLRLPQLPLLHSSLCSLPCGWMQSFLSSAWRMRSVSRLSTTTTAEWPTTGTPVRFHSCWWGPRVSASPARVFLKVFVNIFPVRKDLEWLEDGSGGWSVSGLVPWKSQSTLERNDPTPQTPPGASGKPTPVFPALWCLFCTRHLLIRLLLFIFIKTNTWSISTFSVPLNEY